MVSYSVFTVCWKCLTVQTLWKQYRLRFEFNIFFLLINYERALFYLTIVKKNFLTPVPKFTFTKTYFKRLFGFDKNKI